MVLELTSLKLAISALEKAVASYEKLSKSHTLAEADLDTLKAGVIQNFEVAFEQCWKMMRRWLENNLSPNVADGISRRELFRLAAENSLIADVDRWMEFHLARNLTSHTYSAVNAAASLKASQEFLPVAQAFLASVAIRND